MKKYISYLLICIAIPFVIFIGYFFSHKYYSFISLCVAILGCLAFFLHFEQSKNDTKRLVIIALLVGISVIGRMAFTVIPSFKPTTAITIISAIYFGSETGFMVGSLSALISNFYFGQGAWTPFQMFIWGLIGFIAGLISNPLKKSKIVLCLYGFISGIAFSLIMDIWTVMWSDGFFNINRYLALIITSLPTTVLYIISNILFLLLLITPIGKFFERLKIKYGI